MLLDYRKHKLTTPGSPHRGSDFNDLHTTTSTTASLVGYPVCYQDIILENTERHLSMTTSPEWFAAFFADEDVAIWKPLLYALTTFFVGTTVLYAITKLATTPRILRIPNAFAGSSPTILILRAFYLLETVLRPPTAEDIEDRHCPICKDDFSDPVCTPCGHVFCNFCQ
ncbi:hypothetical protein LTR27_001957 [Elasticomyces elasticus]|nr:hypothetical protein LTR27_001957 [Elasticomyces elasticus]